MKRILLITGAVLLVIASLIYYGLPRYAISLVKNYDPFTFERVLLDDTMRVHYGIYDKSNPADYGFTYETVELVSIYDQINLISWYVPSSKLSTRTIVLVHGRWSNRLKTMKYLQLIKDTGLDTLYNVMIPDLRNSGESGLGDTMVGYEFSEDITTNLLWLNDEKEQTEIILYGFSMGAMAVATLPNREDLNSRLKDAGISISKIIMDSPVAHVERILRRGGEETGLPHFVLDRTMDLLNEEYDGFPSKMTLSNLLDGLKIPVLILQGTEDISQPIDILEDELEKLTGSDISYASYEGAEHVRIYQEDRHRSDYELRIQQFINGN